MRTAQWQQGFLPLGMNMMTNVMLVQAIRPQALHTSCNTGQSLHYQIAITASTDFAAGNFVDTQYVHLTELCLVKIITNHRFSKVCEAILFFIMFFFLQRNIQFKKMQNRRISLKILISLWHCPFTLIFAFLPGTGGVPAGRPTPRQSRLTRQSPW